MYDKLITYDYIWILWFLSNQACLATGFISIVAAAFGAERADLATESSPEMGQVIRCDKM